MTFKPGDRVEVMDEGLAMLREIVHGPPNNTGTVESVEDGYAFIIFDGPEGEATSNCAPYPVEDVRALAPPSGSES